MIEFKLIPKKIGMTLFYENLLVRGKRNQGDPFAAPALQLDPVFSHLGDKASAKTTQILQG